MSLELDDLARLAWIQTWQVTIVALAVGVVAKLCCRDRPRLAYALWMLVVLKAVVPPVLSSPTGVFSWARAGRGVSAIEQRGRPPLILAASQAGALAGAARVMETSGAATPRAAHRLVLFSVWLAGLVICAGWVAVKQLVCWNLIRRSVLPVDEPYGQALAELKARLGFKRKVDLIVTSRPVGPAAFGVVRPAILIPAPLVSSAPLEQLRLILAHELIHIRRGDVLAGKLQLVAQVIWWFHPLVWWANREACRERERCCDLDVVAGVGCKPALYARTLLGVIEQKTRLRSLFPLPGVRALEVTSQRLESIMKRTDSDGGRASRVSRLVFGAGALLLIPGAGLTLKADPPRDDGKAAPRPVAVPAREFKSATEWALAEAGRLELDDRAAAAAKETVKTAFDDLERAQDRLEWAERMFKKGYVSPESVNAERIGLEKARLLLAQAQAGAGVATVTLKGVVREKGTGRPLAGVQVSAAGANQTAKPVVTDANGRYVVKDVPKSSEYSLIAMALGGEPYFIASRAVDAPNDPAVVETNLELVRGIPFRVRVLDHETGKPLTGALSYFPISPNNPFERGVTGYVTKGKASLGAFYEADPNVEGDFFGAVLPGPGILCFNHPYEKGDERRDFTPILTFPDGKDRIKLDFPNEATGAVAFVPLKSDPISWTGLRLRQYAAVIAIDPREGAQSLTYETRIPPRKAAK